MASGAISTPGKTGDTRCYVQLDGFRSPSTETGHPNSQEVFWGKDEPLNNSRILGLILIGQLLLGLVLYMLTLMVFQERFTCGRKAAIDDCR